MQSDSKVTNMAVAPRRAFTKDKAAPAPARDMVMISHANPEDDDLAIWLATQLANEGYKVWCDKVQFLAGEQFWSDIDQIIRARAYKFVYILSGTSNELGLRGFTKELNLAMTVQRTLVREHGPVTPYRRFVVPVAIDDLPTTDYNVHFAGGTNVLPFQSWAQGFGTLRMLLKQDKVPTFRQNNPAVVKDWWNSYRSVSQGRQTRKHKIASNFFPLVDWPDSLFVHQSSTESAVDPNPSFPVYQKKAHLFSFATAKDLEGTLGPNVSITATQEISMGQLLSRNCPASLRPYRSDLAALLRICWETGLEQRGDIRFYEMANGKHAAYFVKPDESDSLGYSFRLSAGFKGRRKLVGSFGGGTRKDGTTTPKHYYHLAIDARPIIAPFGYQLISHVVFTDNGQTPWESKARTHTVRRGFCSQWYNDRWRDCLLAWVSWLAEGEPVVGLSVGSTASLELRVLPRLYTSFVFFKKVAPSRPDDSTIDLAEDVEPASDLLDAESENEDDDESEEEVGQ